MPSETSVSMDEDRCRACRSAAAWNGHAAQVATGTASATSSHCQPGNRVHGKTDSISEASVSGTKNTSASVSRRRSRRTAASSAAPVRPGPAGRGQLRGVAGGLDHADQVGRGDGGWGGDVSPFGRKVDGRGNAGHLVQLGLDPRGAGGAGHAADDQLDLDPLGGLGSDGGHAGHGTRRGHGVPGPVTGASMVTVPEWRKVSVSGTVARDSYGDGCWRTRSSPSGVRVRVPCAGMTSGPALRRLVPGRRGAAARRGGRGGCVRRQARRGCR